MSYEPSLPDLFRMVQSMRPHDSLQEQRFVNDWLVPLDLKIDSFGNLYKWIGQSKTCWASHMDTCHIHGGVQLVAKEGNKLVLSKHSKSNCLGGDDTAGVWLMMQMIKAEKPGMYLFHRGEEKGCLGSSFIAEHNKRALSDIKAVISLDRRSTKSVITFQRGLRCCSNKFGESLAGALGLSHELDQGGIYTDSAKYTDIVGECSNLSVGFDGEHSKNESIDLPYINALAKALINMDDTKLVYERKPGAVESRWSNNDYGGVYGNYGRRSYWEKDLDREDWDDYYKAKYRGGYINTQSRWTKLTREEWKTWSGRKKKQLSSVASLLDKDIELVARMFKEWGFDEAGVVMCLDEQRRIEAEVVKNELN